MIFQSTLTLAMTICLAGIVYRLYDWFAIRIGPDAAGIPTSERLMTGLKAILRFLFSRKLISLAAIFAGRILFQIHILRESPVRWLMHMAISWGFIFLLLFHALDDIITLSLFPQYVSTLNPFFFLRNLLGLFVFTGILVALIRRRGKAIRRFTGISDRLVLALLASIIISGFALESVQMVSKTLFDDMVYDYLGSDDPEDIGNLKAFWAKEYPVAFKEPAATTDPLALSEGAVLNDESCSVCHSPATSAFVSFGAATAIRPIGLQIDDYRADIWLYYIHYLLCFTALAILPFSKLFHIVTTSISLLVNAGKDPRFIEPANRATRRSLGLDACTHCGQCSLHCSVGPVYHIIPNSTILPSEKLKALTRFSRKKQNSELAIKTLSEGSFTCTLCLRCTGKCPSGIHLQDIWEASRKDLVKSPYPDIHQQMQKKDAGEWMDVFESVSGNYDHGFEKENHVCLTDNPQVFRGCVQCTVCTSVCPVVAEYSETGEQLDMTPQQIMNLMRLRMKEAALGAAMVWNCVTCYKCQEHCPEGVRVADVLYELRNEACRRLSDHSEESEKQIR